MDNGIDNDDGIVTSLFARALGAVLNEGQGIIITIGLSDAPDDKQDTHNFLVVSSDGNILVVDAEDTGVDYKQGDRIEGWHPEYFGTKGTKGPGALH